MTRQQWEDWKDRNDDWYTPFVALPLVVLLLLAMVLFYLPGLLLDWIRGEP